MTLGEFVRAWLLLFQLFQLKMLTDQQRSLFFLSTENVSVCSYPNFVDNRVSFLQIVPNPEQQNPDKAAINNRFVWPPASLINALAETVSCPRLAGKGQPAFIYLSESLQNLMGERMPLLAFLTKESF